MYSEWASVQREIQTDTTNVSVLQNFPDVVGREVATSVVRSLAQNLSLSASNNEEPSNLSSPGAVKWTMQVLCYGLDLQLSEVETIKDCVNVYCEWFTALTVPHMCVPRPVIDDPNPYVRDMLHHLYNLFVPRPMEAASATVPTATGKASPANQQAASLGLDLVNRQTILCHRVLRMIQSTVTKSTVMTRETWDSLLKFLLAINDTLLSPPIVKDGLGDQLCERILSVLFEMWALACSRFFPSPPMWKTFREMCCNWRHQALLVAQWHRFNTAFTARMLRLMYGPDYPQLQAADDQVLIPDAMNDDCIVQCWFRFLHIIGDPSDLSQPKVISNTPKFLHMALTSDSVIDPHQHRCLHALPDIFHQAMRGLSVLVDAFLGISPAGGEQNYLLLESGPTGVTPPVQRRYKSMSQPPGKGIPKTAPLPSSVRPSSSADTISVGSSHSQLSLDDRLPYAPGRPHVNSVLHLFGQWLVEAALAGVRVHGKVEKVLSRSRTASFHLERDPTISHPSHPDSSNTAPSNSDAGDAAGAVSGTYDAGRAEACGALCRIFCSHRTGEDILALYLSRFYIVLHHGLQVGKTMSEPVLASILFHSCDLLRLDLDGVQILVPQILRALDLILNGAHSRMHYEELISAVELRKASIHLLLSMLSLPLHFRTLPIRPMFGDSLEEEVTFLSLKSRIIDLLLQALLTESDSANTQMLLGGLMLCVEDLALYETAQKEATGSHGNESEEQRSQRPTTDQTSDSAYEVFGHATSLVCNRLMASWKIDMNVALAAIEVLSGLAKVKLTSPNVLMCKRTINWICEFIMYQCSRPAPAHSKDLHSMICAAFHCLVLWLTEHDHLMQDKQCLTAVLEVVELGISGSRSQPRKGQSVDDMAGVQRCLATPAKHKRERRASYSDDSIGLLLQQNRASEVPKLKGDKELKPVSMRVKDAAEQLLTAIMDSVGSFPPPCGPESLCSLLDEESLLRHYRGTDAAPETSDASPHQSLRYFVLDGMILVGLLEQSLTPGQDSLPTVTTLIRGPFGRYAWNMQLRHLPRERKSATTTTPLVQPKRPDPVDDVGVHYNIKHRYFPETVDSIPLFRVDKSVPQLEDTLLDHSDDLTKLQSFIADQVKFEKQVSDRVLDQHATAPFPNPDTECSPPKVCLDFQTARLYLSHFNWLSLEALKEVPNSSVLPSLLMLQTDSPEFLSDLHQLDSVPSRTSETVHVFYVKSGQKLPLEILNNVMSRKNVHPKFLAFVKSLGWPVDVKKHAGWTGHVSTSGKIQPTQGDDEVYPADTGGSLYDGRQQVLYYADVTSEIAFVVPSLHSNNDTSRRASIEPTVAAGGAEKEERQPVMWKLSENQPLKHKSLSLDFEKPPPERVIKESSTNQGRRYSRLSAAGGWSETKIFVVWLERFEDHETFPTSDFLTATCTGLRPSSVNLMRHTQPPSVYVIFIHALKNGLYRIHTRDPLGKTSLAIPLVDAMVVSHRALGSMVRQTASNTFRRRRLDNEGYQPPHARRKVKIKEIVDKYRNKLIEPDFYTALFQGSHKKAVTSSVMQ